MGTFISVYLYYYKLICLNICDILIVMSNLSSKNTRIPSPENVHIDSYMSPDAAPPAPPSSPVTTESIYDISKSLIGNLTNSLNDNIYIAKQFDTWEELNTKENILRGIYAHGFEKPSPIQKRAILSMFDGKDIIAQAQSGTGKTGCFAIGALHMVNETSNTTQVIILSPTRELSMQTKHVVDSIGAHCKNITTKLLVGGTSSEKDIHALSRSAPHIVVGCPGRIYDMLRRKKIKAESLSLVILDEADEMLSSGFKDQIYDIFQFLPQKIQIALFSATMPIELAGLTETFLQDPVKVLVKTEQLTLEGIRQYYIALENDNEKYEALKDLYGELSVSQCIIYCNSVNRVQDLYDAMIKDDFPVCQIHSGMDKFQREKSYKEFTMGTTRVMISSNVTARGIDVQQVSTVINFDVPRCVHSYLHRIGRSGRWGRKGMGINFVTKRDVRNMREIEQYYSTTVAELPANFSSLNK